jgi:hypothetical protein
MKIYKPEKAALRTFKVFGVGLPRTATNTLAWMLAQLGWRTAHHETDPLRYDTHDAVTDIPTHLYMISSDVRFSGSRFILTRRPVDDWLRSWKSWLEANPPNADMRRARLAALGCADYDEQRLRAIYDRHLAFVNWYFENYLSGRSLTINLCDRSVGDREKWFKLCTFLGVVAPDIELPIMNQRKREPNE